MDRSDPVKPSASSSDRATAHAAAPDALRLAGELLEPILKAVGSVDQQGAIDRLQQLKREHPDKTRDELVETLIKRKVQQTGLIGAVTSGAALVPGLGTLASITLGTAADVGATFRLQAELVMEIAAAHSRLLDDHERQQAILLVTGLSAGASRLIGTAGRRASLRIGQRSAARWLTKALPLVGMMTAAGINALSTYIIGQRAHAYFSLGPSAVGDWKESTRAITGLDERKIVRWLSAVGISSWEAAAIGLWQSSQAVTQASRSTGRALRSTTTGALTGFAATGKALDTATKAVKQASSQTRAKLGSLLPHGKGAEGPGASD